MFVMVLGFSRMVFARSTISMKLPTFLACLQEGVERFGVAKELLVDNIKPPWISTLPAKRCASTGRSLISASTTRLCRSTRADTLPQRLRAARRSVMSEVVR